MGDDNDTATQEQRHAGWRNTYSEHGTHGLHRAHVPSTDGLIANASASYIAARDGRPCGVSGDLGVSEGTADDENDTATQ
jgi:hypothetical protein